MENRLWVLWNRFGTAAIVAVVLLMIVWYFSPGLPVMRAPRASEAAKQAGRELFEREWEPRDALAKGDGLGPVFNEASCVACHFQGGVGGSGPSANDVVSFEIHPTRRDPGLRSGSVHLFAIDPGLQETEKVLRAAFPIVPNGRIIRQSCGMQTFANFDPVRKERLNTTALFGAGWIDRVSDKAIKHKLLSKDLRAAGRELTGDFSPVPGGRPRYLSGGRIGKFGWKAQFATLEEFVAAACANELGLGTPEHPQSRPLGQPGYPEAPPDLDAAQLTHMVKFVDTLPRPTQEMPSDAAELAKVRRGRELFETVGCAACHTPDLGGVEGLFSDLLLHRTQDPDATGGYDPQEPVVPLPEGHPLPDEWRTPPLWGVADSAPYMHDGGAPTLDEAIRRHAGDAKRVTRAYLSLGDEQRAAIVAFLKTLRAPPDAPAVSRTGAVAAK